MKNLDSVLQSIEDVLIDFDGVIMNTEEIVLKIKEETGLNWNELFAFLNWKEVLQSSVQINGSLDIIRELQKFKILKGIITKIHTYDEMQQKAEFIRRNRIMLPIIFCPPKVNKSQIYIPTPKTLLIDDSYGNIDDWNAHHGIGLLFDEKNLSEYPYKTNNLNILRKVLQ